MPKYPICTLMHTHTCTHTHTYNTYLSSLGALSCFTIVFLIATPAFFAGGNNPTRSAAVVLFLPASSGLAPCWRSHSTTSDLADPAAETSGVHLQRNIKTCHTNTIIIFNIQTFSCGILTITYINTITKTTLLI